MGNYLSTQHNLHRQAVKSLCILSANVLDVGRGVIATCSCLYQALLLHDGKQKMTDYYDIFKALKQ